MKDEENQFPEITRSPICRSRDSRHMDAQLQYVRLIALLKTTIISSHYTTRLLSAQGVLLWEKIFFGNLCRSYCPPNELIVAMERLRVNVSMQLLTRPEEERDDRLKTRHRLVTVLVSHTGQEGRRTIVDGA